MVNSRDALAVCPFFHTQDKNIIVCESLIEKAMDNVKFGRADKKELHFKMYCSSEDYKKCKRARVLNLVYEGVVKL